MVARRHPGGVTKPNIGSFIKRRKPGDPPVKGKQASGRPPGAKNKMPATVKALVFEAMERLGADGKGKDGALGYVMSCMKDRGMGLQLLLKILPMQVTGKNDGPVQVFNIPPEQIKGMPTPELELLNKILDRIGGKIAPTQLEFTKGDGGAYADEIGMTEH